MTPKVLGEIEYVTAFRFPISPSKEELLEIMDRCISYVGMTIHGEPDIRVFPDEQGKGGVGSQVYRALTESYMVGGTWDNLRKMRLLISSCEPYDRIGLVKFLMNLCRVKPDKFKAFDF